MRGVVGVLADHRILRRDESGRWENFHDVLAGAVLGWKGRYDAERAVERTRAEARRRHGARVLAFGALVALAAMTASRPRPLAAHRGARPGALRAERSARLRAPSPWWTAIPSSGSARPRGRADRADRAGGERPPARRWTRRASAASSRPGIPVSRWTSCRPAPRARRRRRRRRTVDALETGRCTGRRRSKARRRRSSTAAGRSCHRRLGARHARRGDRRAARESPSGSRSPASCRTSSQPRRHVCDPAGRQAAGARRSLDGRGPSRAGQDPHVVTDAAFSPNGRLVASGGRDWTGRVWSTRTWREVRSRSSATPARCWPWRSTGPVFASRRAAPTRRPECRGPERGSRSRAVGRTAMSTTSRRPGGVLVTASGDGRGPGGRTAWPRGRSAATAGRYERLSSPSTARSSPEARTERSASGTRHGHRPRPRAGVGGPTPLAEGRLTDGTAGTRVDDDVIRLRTASASVLEGHKDEVDSVAFGPDGGSWSAPGATPT